MLDGVGDAVTETERGESGVEFRECWCVPVYGEYPSGKLAFLEDNDLPEVLEGRRYYQPTNNGAEKEIAERLEMWRSLGSDKNKPD